MRSSRANSREQTVTLNANDETSWRARLAGQPYDSDPNHPDYGFYRIRRRDRNGWKVYAYWYAKGTGELRCLCDGRPLDETAALEQWLWASRNAITFDQYNAALDGEPWPDLSEAVTRINAAPDDDSYEGILAAINALESEAKRLIAKGAAKTKDEADVAGDIADKLGKLWKKADVARETEKRPHLEAERAVDDKWRPVLTAATIYKRLKEIVCQPWLAAETAKKRKAEAEARAKAEAAARAAHEAAEKARQEQETAAKSGSIKSEVAADKATEAAEAAGRAAAEAKQQADYIAASTVTAGVRGRGVHLRSETVVTIEDRDAVLAFFKDRQEITDCLLMMAKKANKAGVVVPGVKVEQDSKAA
jgi:hypothetical protein